MDEASYEARKRPLESDLPEQIEVRVRRERRRRWTPVDKLRIVEEAFAPGAVAKRVAERHEISTGLLFTWRRQLMVDASARFQPVQLRTLKWPPQRHQTQHHARTGRSKSRCGVVCGCALAMALI